MEKRGLTQYPRAKLRNEQLTHVREDACRMSLLARMYEGGGGGQARQLLMRRSPRMRHCGHQLGRVL
jgi:hypothetical protein